MKKIYLTGIYCFLLISGLFAQQQQISDINKSTGRAKIVPSIVTLSAQEQQQFHIVIAATRLTAPYNPTGTVWYVNGIAGGNAQLGTISGSGLYKAPSIVNGKTEITITGKTNSAVNTMNRATVLLNGKAASFKTILTFSEPVTALKNFKDPVSIAVEKNGAFLVADAKILRFSSTGRFMGSFGEQKGDIIGHLDGLLNVAVDKEGKIFASDQKITPPRLMAFNQQGKHLYSFGLKGYHPGMCFNTRGIDFDTKNRMYIGDIDLQRITVFDNAGKYQFHFGTPGKGSIYFNGYYDLALDQNNDVFVANYFGGCQKLDAKGNYLLSFAGADPPDGIVYTTDVAADSHGNVYVAVHGPLREDGSFSVAKDKNGNPVNIIKYNNNGDFITNISLSDPERTPVSVVIDHADRLVVLFKNKKETGVEVLKATE